jgi:hypothetical protein
VRRRVQYVVGRTDLHFFTLLDQMMA